MSSNPADTSDSGEWFERESFTMGNALRGFYHGKCSPCPWQALREAPVSDGLCEPPHVQWLPQASLGAGPCPAMTSLSKHTQGSQCAQDARLGWQMPVVPKKNPLAQGCTVGTLWLRQRQPEQLGLEMELA